MTLHSTILSDEEIDLHAYQSPVHTPISKAMIHDLFAQNWSPNRIPTDEERVILWRLIEDDTQSIARMNKELERLARCVERRAAAVENYSRAEAIARELRKTILSKYSSLTLVQDRLIAIDRTAPSGSSKDESYDACLKIMKTLEISKKECDSQLLACTSEVDALNAQIEGYCVERETQRRHLDTLEESARALSGWITLREEDIAFKKDILSVRRLVPVEIWGEIFRLRLVEDQVRFRLSQRTGIPPFTPLTLSAVCRYWRAIVAQYPVLWQNIAVPHHDKIMESQRDRILYYRDHLGYLLPKVYTYHHDIVSGVFPIPLLPFLKNAFGPKYASLEITNYTFSLLRGPEFPNFLDKLQIQTTHLTIHSKKTAGLWRFGRTSFGKRFEIPLHMLSELREVKGMGLGIALPSPLPPIYAQPTINLSTIAVKDTVWKATDIQACFAVAKGIERLEMTAVTIDPRNASQRINVPSILFLKCDMKEYPTLQTLIDTPNVATLELVLGNTFEPLNWLDENKMRLVSKNVKSLTLEGWDLFKASLDEDAKILEAILPKFPEVSTLTLVQPRIGACLDVLATYSTPLSELKTLHLINCNMNDLLLLSFRSRYNFLHKRHVEVIVTSRPPYLLSDSSLC
ncbi:SubName: Full=Uncharacterized protein {ECO:0000313/EMBL:CCA71613.1} [Serendipita indica DSM 11827]|nr:SubName: Full=Uncharacterized protein {ECO:0000313/EMBL:CCA71613.1} [Serendipita indica DSM 11827]